MEDQNTPQGQPTNNPEVEQAPVQSTPAPLGPSPSGTETQPSTGPSPTEPFQPPVPQNVAEVSPSEPPKAQPPQTVPAVSMEEKIFGMLSYVILLSLFTLLLKPKSAFVRLHGRQGLVMTVFFFLSFFLVILPFIGAALTSFVVLAIFVANLYSMYQCLIGNWWKIPAVGDIAEQIPMTLFEKVGKEAATAITGNPSSSNQPAEEPTPPEDNPPSAQPPVQPS